MIADFRRVQCQFGLTWLHLDISGCQWVRSLLMHCLAVLVSQSNLIGILDKGKQPSTKIEHLYCKHLKHITQSNLQICYIISRTKQLDFNNNWCSEWFVPAKSCPPWNLFCFCPPAIIFGRVKMTITTKSEKVTLVFCFLQFIPPVSILLFKDSITKTYNVSGRSRKRYSRDTKIRSGNLWAPKECLKLNQIKW